MERSSNGARSGVGGSLAAGDVAGRVERLNVASLRRIIEPDEAVAGEIGPGQVLPDGLLSVADLDLGLSAEQRATLSREELASIVQEGIRFEAVLMAGFSARIAQSDDLADPRVVYMLHEIGEETRHSRLFSRMLGQLQPRAVNPLATSPVAERIFRYAFRRILAAPALLLTLVLAGEEIPDLMQKRAAEDPDTDPFVRAVNRYHRLEEARHLAYARLVFPEAWAEAGSHERFLVRHVAPRIIFAMFNGIVHPGVYATVGLPTWKTWRAANRSPSRIALRREATRPVLDAVIAGGAVRRGRVPKGWRQLCGVDHNGDPIGPATGARSRAASTPESAPAA